MALQAQSILECHHVAPACISGCCRHGEPLMKLCICLAEQADCDNAAEETVHGTDAASNTEDPATASA